MSNDEIENRSSEQALEPVEQESIVFHEQDIVAVRLADGRICVVLRWICESLKLAPNPQVRRIERTAATAEELVRVKVQTRGGRQTMPAITLRGFTPWVLGLNPNEVQDEEKPQEAERIRALIIAYQTEAKDVLYEHFVNPTNCATRCK
jgi:P22_AR N-terminal domain